VFQAAEIGIDDRDGGIRPSARSVRQGHRRSQLSLSDSWTRQLRSHSRPDHRFDGTVNLPSLQAALELIAQDWHQHLVP
jgi:hypothetical protein